MSHFCLKHSGNYCEAVPEWVTEIRDSHTKERIWLGSFATAEMAARAYDAGVVCLKGESAKLPASISFKFVKPHVCQGHSSRRCRILCSCSQTSLHTLPHNALSTMRVNTRPSLHRTAVPKISISAQCQRQRAQQMRWELWRIGFTPHSGSWNHFTNRSITFKR